MAWRYINPGYGSWFNDSAVTTTESVVYNPSNKVAFQKALSSSSILAISLPEGLTTDLYCRFDMYIKTSPYNFYIGVYSPNAIGNRAWIMGIRIRSYWAQLYYAALAVGNGMALKGSELNKIFFHLHLGGSSSDAYGELVINNSKETVSFEKHSYYGFTSANNNEFIFATPSITDSGDGAWISNLIISNEEINYKEQIVALPVSTTETAMSLQGDTYLADSVGQTLLQSVNVSSLIDEYGSESKVTGIAVVGNPAYCTGEQLSSLTAISKRGGVVTEHGTSNLSTASDTVICQGFSTASDTMIADLQNMQFGWKASE